MMGGKVVIKSPLMKDSKSDRIEQDSSNLEDSNEDVTFESLGLIPSLLEAIQGLGYQRPTSIQKETIPVALQGKDIIGLAQTGSGKTAAFSLPILQALSESPQGLFACIISPTRELALQIADHIKALGSVLGVKVAAIVGGVDSMQQAIALAKKPHIIVCTPGRLVEHLEETKGFSLKSVKYLVLDEADKLLDQDFQEEIDKILIAIPREGRHTYLFSATVTDRVERLQRASLTNPVKISIASKHHTVDTLLQYYVFLPFKDKNTYTAYFLNELAGNRMMVFTARCASTQKLALLLRHLGFAAVPIHGQMSQPKRFGALEKFKSGQCNILIATDVAARGLDISQVDCVINYDLPANYKDYVHRVGRTARAGRAGKAIAIVTQYDVEYMLNIEKHVGKKFEEYPAAKDQAMLLAPRVFEAERFATMDMREKESNGKNRRGKKGGAK